MPKKHKGISIDRIPTADLENKIDPHTGFLHTKVVICRSGIQEYLGQELGLTGDDAGKIFNVLRHPDDVTNENSLATYKNIVITDEHPAERWVNLDNIKQLQKGQVSEIDIDRTQQEVHINGDMVITDQDLINKTQSGKVEVSLGYAYEIIAEDGVYNGTPYQFKYTNMIANHLSVVEKGRCGGSCKIVNDKKDNIDKKHDIIVDEQTKNEGVLMKITINGKEFEVSDEVGNALKEERKSKDEEVEKVEKKVEDADKKAEDAEEKTKEAEKATDVAAAKIDDLNVKLTKANDSKISNDDMNKLVQERASLIAFAGSVIGNDNMPDSICPMVIKTAVVEKHFNISVDGKSDAYIDARFEMVQEDQVAHDSSVQKLANDMEANKKVATDNEKKIDDARTAYLNRKGL